MDVFDPALLIEDRVRGGPLTQEEIAAWARCQNAAAAAGLDAVIRDRRVSGHKMFAVRVSRDEPDWSLESTEIAISQTIPGVCEQAIAAIQKMQPRLAKALDAASPYPEDDPSKDRIAVALERIADALERMAPPELVRMPGFDDD